MFGVSCHILLATFAQSATGIETMTQQKEPSSLAMIDGYQARAAPKTLCVRPWAQLLVGTLSAALA